jgi:hypothetical protein
VSVRAERFIAIAKDVILFVGGLSGIAYQQITNNINPLLLLIFATMTGIPGLMNVISLWRSGMFTGSAQLPSQPSQPQSGSQPSSGDKGTL